ncbi:MAG: LysR family transcriptional regulator [Myxococcota bacterium]
MRLRDMELLVRIAESGSMTVAAQRLHLTPAAVSAAVNRVEDSIGIRLFERSTRALHLTDEGLVVIEACQEVVDMWQRTLEEVHDDKGALVGPVHIASPADTTYEMLAPLIAAVSADHPKLRVVVHSSDAIQHLLRDAIDIAIRYGTLQDSALSANKLADCPGIYVAAPSYIAEHGEPQTPQALNKHRCLTLQLSNTPLVEWTLYGNGSTYEIPLQTSLCGDGFLSRQWAIAGMGIAYKSLFDVIDDLESGRLVRVLPQYTGGSVPIHAVFPSRRFKPARVRALETAIATSFSARAARCDRWLSQSRPELCP